MYQVRVSLLASGDRVMQRRDKFERWNQESPHLLRHKEARPSCGRRRYSCRRLTKLTTLARGLQTYDRRCSSYFPSRTAELRIHLTLGAPDSFTILQGRECSKPPRNAETVENSAGIRKTIEKCRIDNIYFYSSLFLATNRGAQKVAEPFEGRSIDYGAGDGKAVWPALVDDFTGFSMLAVWPATKYCILQAAAPTAPWHLAVRDG